MNKILQDMAYIVHQIKKNIMSCVNNNVLGPVLIRMFLALI